MKPLPTRYASGERHVPAALPLVVSLCELRAILRLVKDTSEHIYRGKSPWYPLDRSLGGSESRSGHGGEDENFDHPARSPTLYQIRLYTIHL